MAAPHAVDLCVGQVAGVLQCSEDTVRRLAKTGKLPGYKVGRDWRFHQTSVDNFRRPIDPPHNPAPKTRVPARRTGAHLPGWHRFDR